MNTIKKIINQFQQIDENVQLIRLYLMAVIFSSIKVIIAILLDSVSHSFLDGSYKSGLLSVIILLTSSVLSVFLLRWIQREKYDLGFKVEHKVTDYLITNLGSADVETLEEDGQGNWISIFTNDIKQISNLTTNTLIEMFIIIIQFLLGCIYGLIVSPVLTVFIVLMSAFSFFIPKYINKMIILSRTEQQSSLGNFNSTIINIIKQIDLVQSMRLESFVLKIFSRDFNDYNAKRYNHAKNTILMDALSTGFGFILTTSWISLAFYLIQQGNLSLGQFLGFMILDSYFTNIFFVLPTYYSQAVSEVVSIDRLEEFKSSIFSNTKKSGYFNKQVKEIKFDNISFKYSKNNQYIFENLKLRLQEGNKLLISGESGKGKTTLLKLIIGLYEPDDGIIKINGTVLNDTHNLSQFVGYVPQINIIFNRTLKENIQLNSNLSHKRLTEIIELAGLSDLVQQLPKGIETKLKVGLNQNLSEGQIQRIGMARAIAKDAPILVLDEPTSALDYDSEMKIIDYLRNTEKIVILTTHRRMGEWNDLDVFEL